MRRFVIILVLTIVAFGLINLTTAKIERHFDGNDTYGYPLTFYTKLGGKCQPCPDSLSQTNYLNLLVDLSFGLVVGVVTGGLIEAVRKQFRTSSE
jgi:hypothetical protein